MKFFSNPWFFFHFLPQLYSELSFWQNYYLNMLNKPHITDTETNIWTNVQTPMHESTMQEIFCLNIKIFFLRITLTTAFTKKISLICWTNFILHILDQRFGLIAKTPTHQIFDSVSVIWSLFNILKEIFFVENGVILRKKMKKKLIFNKKFPALWTRASESGQLFQIFDPVSVIWGMCNIFK
jgi:hypothetical protein